MALNPGARLTSLARVAGGVAGFVAGVAATPTVWRALRSPSLNEWGDEHMEAMAALSLGSVLVGAVTGSFLGYRLARSLFRQRDMA